MNIAPMQLVWSEEAEANEQVRYNHTIAETPLGRFLVTWKGWKKYASITIDETPWGDFGGVACDLADAKEMAQKMWNEKIQACLQVSDDTQEQPHDNI